MSASSQYWADKAPHGARLNNDGPTPFWVASNDDIQDSTRPWLQVDFLTPLVITGVQTQGAGIFEQYVTTVQIQYGQETNGLKDILENGSPKVI